MAPHSSTLAWKIPWTEEPGRLQSMGLLRVGHDWATSLSLSCIGEGNGNPLQCSCLENPRNGGAWWAAIYGVAQSRTRLKWVSSKTINILKFFISVSLSLIPTGIMFKAFWITFWVQADGIGKVNNALCPVACIYSYWMWVCFCV